MYKLVLSQHHDINSIIDDLIDLYGIDSFDSCSFSDKCLIVSEIIKAEKCYDWLDALAENNIKKTIVDALSNSAEENHTNLIEEIKKSLVDQYKHEIDDLIKERHELSLIKEDTSYENDYEGEVSWV